MAKKIIAPVAEVTSNPSTEIVAAAAPTTRTIKTKPEDRKYAYTEGGRQIVLDSKFTGKQRIEVLQSLHDLGQPSTAKEVAARCLTLKAKAGVEPSVRYHLHLLTILGVTYVTNPTSEVEVAVDEQKAA